MIARLQKPRDAVVEAELADAALLAEIHGRCFSHRWSEEEFAALMRERSVTALLFRRDTRLAKRLTPGFVLLRQAADEAEILTLAVSPRWRKRGIGRVLTEEAMRRLYREGVVRVFLEVDEGNIAALALYRKLGFEEISRRKGYYVEAGEGRTALVMRVQLR